MSSSAAISPASARQQVLALCNDLQQSGKARNYDHAWSLSKTLRPDLHTALANTIDLGDAANKRALGLTEATDYDDVAAVFKANGSKLTPLNPRKMLKALVLRRTNHRRYGDDRDPVAQVNREFPALAQYVAWSDDLLKKTGKGLPDETTLSQIGTRPAELAP